MSGERGTSDERFLARWSRLKSAPENETVTAPAAAQPAVPPAQVANDEPPSLPPVEELTIDSDFRGFLHPKVNEDVRRAALRKLFSDPHFNVMDGLDVYIDDYSKADPIPPEMLAGLKQAQRIVRWAAGKDDADDEAETADDAPPDTPALAAAEPTVLAEPGPVAEAEPAPAQNRDHPD